MRRHKSAAISSFQLPASLLASIYEAATEPSRWPDVVQQMTRWAGGVVGGLQIRHLHPRLSMSIVTCGLDREFENAYNEHYFRIDPHLARVKSLVEGETLLSREILPDDDLMRTVYYNEFCRPQGLCDLQGATLLRDETRVVSFAMYSSNGRRFDDNTRGKLNALVPHLTRALRYALTLEAQRETHLVVHAAAAARHLGLVCVDGSLTVLDTAGDAVEWLEAGAGPLKMTGRRLVARQLADMDVLRNAVRAAIGGKTSYITLGSRSPRTARVTCVPAPPSSLLRPIRSAYLLFTVSAKEAGDAGSSVLEPRFELRAEHSLLYGLPRSLHRVAAMLGRGLTDKELATELDLPIATARTYVARVLKRLRVHGRREVMLLMR